MVVIEVGLLVSQYPAMDSFQIAISRAMKETQPVVQY